MNKIAVAMSGGVDSSVAALLLKKAGYDVTGITMRLWPCETPGGQSGKKTCCSVADMEDAKNTAARIGIPHYTLDMRDAFKKLVIRPFCDAYLSGKTPNPCVICNEAVKFGIFFEKAKALGIRRIATGHYAIISRTKTGAVLKKASDKKNDQSYWLYPVAAESLEASVFPLGRLTKKEVRHLAAKNNLSNAEKPKSQEICFIPDNDYRGFIKRFAGLKTSPGYIVNSSGRVIGKHEGFFNYTTGQRRGLGSINGKKMYVVRIVPEKNIVIAGAAREIYGSRLTVENPRFNPALIKSGKLSYNVRVKIRNQHPAAAAKLIVGKSAASAVIVFNKPQMSITPGQSAVFYTGESVLGGGIISGWEKQ